MKILITGASGLIGSALSAFLGKKGHQVARLVRSAPKAGDSEIFWDPAAGKLDATALEGFDAVIHLAGDNIGSGRWTAAKKAKIKNSRVQGTKLLSETLSKLSKPPKVLVSASAVGFYGDRGEAVLDEESAPGAGFLAEACREWEEATASAKQKGIRVVNLRIGVVLSPHGGALSRMLTPFKMGVGGKLGNGKQYMSWVDLEDLIEIIHYALTQDSLSGPVNALAPNPATNREFTKALGKVISRPTIFPMPAFAARLAFGEMADEVLLASARVKPNRLLNSGYIFRYPELEASLRHVLEKN